MSKITDSTAAPPGFITIIGKKMGMLLDLTKSIFALNYMILFTLIYGPARMKKIRERDAPPL
jgi:hypothetical protein